MIPTWESGIVLTTFLHVKYKQKQEEWGGKSKNLNIWESNSAIIPKQHFAAHALTEICPGIK